MRCWPDAAARDRIASTAPALSQKLHLQPAAAQQPPRPTRNDADARAGGRGQLRLQQPARVGGRQRADVLQRHQLEADKVIYDQKTKRLHAEGNIRLTDADGKITYANIIDLSDDYRDGFVDSLRVDTADETRMAATRADRSASNITVFQNGVYTACEPCKDDPKKPPLWQVKAARIIHDQTEKMLYFENARLEFFGVPMAYLPYFSTPDPTVKRKTGFLMPWSTVHSGYGFGVEPVLLGAGARLRRDHHPAHHHPAGPAAAGRIAAAPDQRRLQIRAYGRLIKLRPRGYAGRPGYREFRGGVDTKGQFALNDKWVWGWDGVLLSDYFFTDYRLQVQGPWARS